MGKNATNDSTFDLQILMSSLPVSSALIIFAWFAIREVTEITGNSDVRRVVCRNFNWERFCICKAVP